MPTFGSLLPVAARRRLLALLRVMLDFFRRWVRADVNTLVASLTVLGGLTRGLESGSDILRGMRRYLSHFFTSSIAISEENELNHEVLNWLRVHALEGKQKRSLVAQAPTSAADQGDPSVYCFRDDNATNHELDISYLPTFDMHYLWFQGSLIMVKRGLEQNISLRSLFLDRSTAAPKGKEPLLLICLGRTVEPIQK